jgi:Ser-tRNA(Ala) deacylase AlaX
MDDCYLKEFSSRVSEKDENKISLEQTAFYPRGGGLESDTGSLTARDTTYRVNEVRKEKGKVLHILDKPFEGEVGDEVTGVIDWDRRYKTMKLHTGCHSLCAVLNEKTGALITGNCLKVEGESRIDFNLEEMDRELMYKCAEIANEKMGEGKEVKTYYLPREEALKLPGMVKLADRLPPAVKNLRIVEIEGIDRQADGGPHVKNTSEVGTIEITKFENKGKRNRRLYFVLKNGGT